MCYLTQVTLKTACAVKRKIMEQLVRMLACAAYRYTTSSLAALKINFAFWTVSYHLSSAALHERQNEKRKGVSQALLLQQRNIVSKIITTARNSSGICAINDTNFAEHKWP